MLCVPSVFNDLSTGPHAVHACCAHAVISYNPHTVAVAAASAPAQIFAIVIMFHGTNSAWGTIIIILPPYGYKLGVCGAFRVITLMQHYKLRVVQSVPY